MYKRTGLLPLLLSRNSMPWFLHTGDKVVTGCIMDARTVHLRVAHTFNLAKIAQTKVEREKEQKLTELKKFEEEDANGPLKEVLVTTMTEDGERTTVVGMVDASTLVKEVNATNSVAIEPVNMSQTVNVKATAVAEDPTQEVRDKLDEQMRQVQEQLKRQKERDAQQRNERMQRHQEDIMKMQKNRPAVQKKLKIDLGEPQSKNIFDRQVRLDTLLKECNDVNTLADMVVRLTKDMEEDRLKYRKHMEEYYQLIGTFSTAKKQLTAQIAESKATASKQIIHELLEIADGLEEITVNQNASNTGTQLSQLKAKVLEISAALQALFKRHDVVEIAAKEQQFDHTRHQLAGEAVRPDMPANIVLDVTKKGYMIREQCIRLAQVIVSRHK